MKSRSTMEVLSENQKKMNDSADSRERFFKAVNSQNLTELFLIDPENFEIEYANSGALENMGYSQDEIRGMKVTELSPQCTDEGFGNLIRPLSSSDREHLFFYTENTRKDGSIYSVEVQLQLVDKFERPLLLASMVDASRRESAESELRHREESLRRAEKIAGMGNWTLDVQTGEMEWSDNLCKLLRKEDCRAKKATIEQYKEMVFAGDLPEYNDQLDKVTNSGNEVDFECRFLIDNKVHYFLNSIRLLNASEGKASHIFGIVRDITDTVESEREKLKLNAILNGMFEGTADVIFVKNDRGVYDYVNRAFCESLNTTGREVIGKTDFELFPEETALRFRADDQKVIKTGKIRTYEEQVDTPEGKRDFLTTKGPLVFSGEVYGIFAITRDVTDQKRARTKLETQNEELKRVNAELDRFVYHTAHDLRAPLTSVLSLIDLSKERHPEDAELTEMFSLMKKSIKRSDGVISKILDISRNVRTDIEVEKVCVRATVTEILDSISDFPGTDQMRFEVDIPENDEILSDGQRLRAILSNLIINSIKYARRDEPDKFVKISSRRKRSRYMISVEDNGEGIPERMHSKVFDMFVRVSSRSEGSGLGLYIVKQMTKALNGKVTVRTRKPRGTIFTLEFQNDIRFLPGNAPEISEKH